MPLLHSEAKRRKNHLLNALDPDAIRVELYAEGSNGGNPVRKEMTRGPILIGAENGYVYGVQVQAT